MEQLFFRPEKLTPVSIGALLGIDPALIKVTTDGESAWVEFMGAISLTATQRAALIAAYQSRRLAQQPWVPPPGVI